MLESNMLPINRDFIFEILSLKNNYANAGMGITILIEKG